MIKKEFFEIRDLESMERENLEVLYEELNHFNKYIYDFVLTYYKYIYKTKDYGTHLNLSMLEAHLVTDITDTPGITANVLAKKWEKTPAYISQRLNRLEKEELIYRELDPDNRKFYKIYATEKGKNFDLKHKRYDIKSIAATNRKLMEKFSLDDLFKMRLIMEEYGRIIGEETE